MKQPKDHTATWTIIGVVVLITSIVLVLASCAPKSSNAHFTRPKYEVHEHAKPGRPNVRQTWWRSGWLWRPAPERQRKPIAP